MPADHAARWQDFCAGGLQGDSLRRGVRTTDGRAREAAFDAVAAAAAAGMRRQNFPIQSRLSVGAPSVFDRENGRQALAVAHAD